MPLCSIHRDTSRAPGREGWDLTRWDVSFDALFNPSDPRSSGVLYQSPPRTRVNRCSMAGVCYSWGVSTGDLITASCWCPLSGTYFGLDHASTEIKGTITIAGCRIREFTVKDCIQSYRSSWVAPWKRFVPGVCHRIHSKDTKMMIRCHALIYVLCLQWYN